jgi:hypothetical protein
LCSHLPLVVKEAATDHVHQDLITISTALGVF